MSGVVGAGRGRWLHAARGVCLRMFRAMGMRGTGIANRTRVHHGQVCGRCHLAQEHDEDNQATMSEPNHRRSVPLRRG